MRRGHPDILRKLISRGWYVDENGRYNDTPLCVASQDGSAAACACIELLCVAGVRTEYGISLQIQHDVHSSSPSSRHGGSSRVVPLLRAVALDHVEAVKALLIGGASVASVHPDTGLTALQVPTSLFLFLI